MGVVEQEIQIRILNGDKAGLVEDPRWETSGRDETKIGNVLGKRVLWFENEIDTSQLKAPSSEQEWEKPKKSEMANPRL